VDVANRILLGFGVAVLCTPAGISGAFLLLPIQVQVLHVPSPAVSATNLLFNIVSAPAGAVTYFRRGLLDRELAVALLAGTTPGVVAGALLRSSVLAEPERFGVVAGVLLLGLGLWTLYEALQRRRARPSRSGLPPSWRITAIGLVAGAAGGIYGIGGAAIVVPWLTTIERLPVARVAGPGLLTTTVTSIVGLVTFALADLGGFGSAAAPDWLNGLALGCGGMGGAIVGARLQPRLPVRLLRALLGCAAIVAALRMFASG
jgi:uncharacterized membrane protein YfcA